MNNQLLRKFYVLLIIVYTICVSTVILIIHQQDRKAALEKMKKQLEFGANNVKYILPNDYFDRAITPDGIPRDEYQYYTKRLTEVAMQGGYIYLYALKNVGGRYFFIASSIDPEDLAKRKFDPYWLYYNKVPTLLTDAFRSQKPEIGKCTDEWGSFYSCFIAMRTEKGNEYIVGADYDLQRFDAVLRNTSIKHLFMLLALLLILIPVNYLLNKMQRLYLLEAETIREILYSTPICVVVVDTWGTIRFANSAFLKVVDIDKTQILKTSVFDPRFQSLPLFERLITCINNNESFAGDFTQKEKDGSQRWKYAVISSTFHEQTNSLLYYAFSQDITEMKDSQIRLQQNNIVLNYLTQASHILLSNPDPLKVIPGIIENMGNCLSRCMVQVVQKVDEEWHVVASWKRHQIDVSIKNATHDTQSLPIYDHWEELLARGTIITAKTPQLPREFLNIIEVYVERNFTIFPIIMKGQLWGFVSTLYRDEDTAIDMETTINSFSSLADSIGAAIERANIEKALRLATDAKSSFLSSISHEIRTPLNGILGMINLLHRTKLDTDQSEFVDAMRSSGNQLQSLIGDVLDISRIEAGKFTIHKTPTNIRGTVFAVQQIVQFQLNEKGLELLTTIDNNVPDVIIADEVRIKQILVNLIGNAVKFTSIGFIKLNLMMLDEKTLQIEIADTGIGMTTEQTQRIFEPFYQAGSMESKAKGTGLGLVITARLVKMMGGDISVSSALGQGTSFVCKIKVITIKESSIYN